MIDRENFAEMKAEFQRHCAEADAIATRKRAELLRDAMEALAGGNPSRRDELLAQVPQVDQALAETKAEIWYRLGEQQGISREVARSWLRRAGH